MDLQMPDMNGSDAMIVIRHEFPHAKIIVLDDCERCMPFKFLSNTLTGVSSVPVTFA
jgi:DNA-binding NarL/FixJ family response regulator